MIMDADDVMQDSPVSDRPRRGIVRPEHSTRDTLARIFARVADVRLTLAEAIADATANLDEETAETIGAQLQTVGHRAETVMNAVAVAMAADELTDLYERR